MNQLLQEYQKKLGKSYCYILGVVMTIVIILIGYTSVLPKNYHFALNQIAEITVRAPKNVEDKVATQEAKQKAQDAIPDAYVFQSDLGFVQSALMKEFFEFLGQVRSTKVTYTALVEYAKTQSVSTQFQREIQDKVTSLDKQFTLSELPSMEQLLVYRHLLDNQSDAIKDEAAEMTDKTITTLLNLSSTSFTEAQTFLTSMLEKTMSEEITVENKSVSLFRAYADIQRDSRFSASSTSLKEFFSVFFKESVVYNESETIRRKREAAELVQPSQILQGQVIVQEGHVVTNTVMRQLELFGYTNAASHNYKAYAFYTLIVFHLAMFFYLFRWRSKKKYHDLNAIEMSATGYMLVMVVALALLKSISLLQKAGVGYAVLIFPMILIPMFMATFLSFKMLSIQLFFFNLFALFILSDASNLTETILPIPYFILSSLIVYIVMGDTEFDGKFDVYFFLKMIFWHAVMIVPLLMGLNIEFYSTSGLNILIFVMMSLVIAQILYFLVYPYWEALLTPKAKLTLNQLANLNHPLLKMLSEKAPGTYHHSIMVANLSANAVEKIGGDTLLTTVASYYHDVGKTVHPLFFVENLPAGYESPHQMVTPQESAAIITQHTLEGERLLREHHLPQSVRDICVQHHGTTAVKYFYYKAKKENDKVDIAAFRYEGPKPQTKEAAVIMIADSVEAASRTLKVHTQESIEKLVHNIIDDKMQDNQFAECQLTVQELKIVKKSLISGIAGMYHTRIEYPDDEAHDE